MIAERISHYRIMSQLGAGGMGEVYLAEDTHLDRQVALKLLPAKFTEDADRVRRFIQEAKAASALNHPNIIIIHEIGELDGLHFIVTEFIEGQTLRQPMTSSQMKLPMMLEVTIQVASALAAAHSVGIVHRDIKPENIMLRPDGYVKVLDFGLAKLTEPQSSAVDTEAPTAANVNTETGVVMGTVKYMSPEQARGLKVDARSDIFSLGVVLYEMVAGQAPFAGATTADVIAAILEKEPPPLARFTPDAPEALERIIAKALRKDREERYQTIKDFLIDLKDLKGELEFKAKLERSAQPAPLDQAKAASRSEPAELQTAELGAADTGKADGMRTTSSAEYLVSEIKRHKLGVGLALMMLMAAIAALVYFNPFGGSGQEIDSLAVLPFVNVGKNPDTEYLSDGITDSLINSLSQLPHLSVQAHSSVFRYKDKEVEAQQVAAALSVQAILYGRVVQRGDDLILYLSLVDGRKGNQLWGDEYHRKLTDLVTLQNGIVRDVSQQLRARLSGADAQRLAKNYTQNAEAYQLYLKGLYEWNKHTQADLQKSIAYYKQALEKDPNYALAYFGLAACYGVLGNNYWPPRDAYPIAKEYAAKALALDDTLAQAHHAMGAMKLNYDWDWAEAEKEFKRAQSLDPNFARAHQLYGDYFEIMGRFDEAKAERKRALELDPLSPAQNMVAGATFYLAGQYDEAIAQLEKTIYLEPHYPPAYHQLGQAYEQKKMYPQAIETLQKGMAQAERSPQLIAELGHAYALAGERNKALEALAELRELSKQHYISPNLFAVVYIGLGDKEQAFAWLEKAYQDRSAALLWLKVEPLFDPLRSEPRFQDLLQRIGLQP